MRIWQVISIIGSLPVRDFVLIEGRVFSWQFKLQKCVALSKTESEYIAATEEAGKSMWMKCFFQELALIRLIVN